MPLDLSDGQFIGPAFPEPFVKFELENELNRLKLLLKTSGAEGKTLKADWDAYRRHLGQLNVRGGPLRVRNQAIEPLCTRLGYTDDIASGGTVETREGRESGGYLLSAKDGSRLRIWVTGLDEDLDAPAKRGQAYRFSHLRSAQRVLLAAGERVGLLTNGVELRLLISDPARPDSQVIFSLDPFWKRSRDVPDSFRVFLALASPDGVRAIPELIDKARLQQARVTKDLRDQARQAIQRFLQEVLDHPDNRGWLSEQTDRAGLARVLWHEGLTIVYRLLFILKLETNDDPARFFSFASTSLWRNTFSPSMALARFAPKVLFDGVETGGMLENGLRGLFRMFNEGLECTELNVKPLGGALFGGEATPVLSRLRWGERAAAHLLDQLLWTTPRKRSNVRERVHYGPLDVEDLGRVYEALLELEPGISTEPMCRLRRQKLEVVVPISQGQKYRPADATVVTDDGDDDDDPEADEDSAEDEDDTPRRGKKTTVQWIEEIPPGRFYLRVGLGRKATGSYYTPHSFVRFLVQETLGPQIAERSPPDNPQPSEILKLRVLDPAMGSGHFLVEACRYLGQHLYEAVRLCDEKSAAALRKAEAAKRRDEREIALSEARSYQQRIIELPDPDDELVRYLPSHSAEGEQSGLSQRKAEALCRRMVAVHCLYGVDKNPLAVELAKLALWLESHAEGMPLTFLDHRLVVGDSLTGPFWERLLTWPGKPNEKLEGAVYQGLENRLRAALFDALRHVKRLEATVGVTLAEVEEKQTAKADLDNALLPFRVAAAAWAGGVMLGPDKCDDVAYAELLQQISIIRELPPSFASESLCRMIGRGLGLGDNTPQDGNALHALVKSGRCVPALSYDLTFPEVFYPNGVPYQKEGFHAILGNPPWDAVLFKSKEFFAAFDFEILNAPTKREREAIEHRLTADQICGQQFEQYKSDFEQQKRINDVLYNFQKVYIDGDLAGRQSDAFRIFTERATQLIERNSWVGMVVPSAFHANEGASGVRKLCLERLGLRHCYSFENRRRLFDIHRSFKFATVVLKSGQPTTQFLCAFYLQNDEWLFSPQANPPLCYSLDFVRRTGGEYLSLLELRSPMDLETAEACFANGKSFGAVCEQQSMNFGRECDMTNDSWRFSPTADIIATGLDPRDSDTANRVLACGYLVLHEGKTFRQYDDHWDKRPQYLVAVRQLDDRRQTQLCARHYRLAHRIIAGPGDENVSIWTLHCPGAVFANSASVEIKVVRPNCTAALLLAILNSYVFDYLLTLRVRANVLRFIRDSQPIPKIRAEAFLAHSTVRLTCNHSGYASLWHEQFGAEWRELQADPFSWPVLSEDTSRWQVRSTIDAVVADAYGLSHKQYAHVLSSFSHSSFPNAPELCLARFEELQRIGLEAFIRKYDPYWDIPLNENLPHPVIELPIPGGEGPDEASEEGEFRLAKGALPKRRSRRKG